MTDRPRNDGSQLAGNSRRTLLAAYPTSLNERQISRSIQSLLGEHDIDHMQIGGEPGSRVHRHFLAIRPRRLGVIQESPGSAGTKRSLPLDPFPELQRQGSASKAVSFAL